LTGCAAQMSGNECIAEERCEWVGAVLDADLFDGSWAVKVVDNEIDYYNQYWMGAYFSLVFAFLYFTYRYFSNKGLVRSNKEESIPLLAIDVEA